MASKRDIAAPSGGSIGTVILDLRGNAPVTAA
jgi:hypothetical protein